MRWGSHKNYLEVQITNYKREAERTDDRSSAGAREAARTLLRRFVIQRENLEK